MFSMRMSTTISISDKEINTSENLKPKSYILITSGAKEIMI